MKFFIRLLDNSPTNQLAVSQVVDWSTRGLVNSPTAGFLKEYRSRSVAVLTPFLWFPSPTYTGHSTNI